MAVTVTKLVAELGLDSKPMEQGMGKVDGQLKKSGGRLMGITKKLGKTTALAVGAAVTGALVSGFKRLTDIENAEASLRGLGHSAEAVKGIMTNAMASVKGTAFGLNEAASVAASAVASGIKPGQELERTLRLTADAATIGGTSMDEMGMIFNKVAAAGKLTGREMTQLNQRTIPIQEMLAKSLGKTKEEVMELARRGEIDFATFADAMEQGLGGAALESGKTTMGALKNVGAAASRLGASLIAGVFPLFKDAFNGAIVALDKLEERVGPAAERVGQAIGDALKSDVFKDTVSGLGEGIKTFASETAARWHELAGLLVDAGIMDVFSDLWAHVQTIAAELKMTLDHIAGWWAEHREEIMQAIGPLVSGLQTVLSSAMEVIRGIMDIIAGIIRTVLAVIRGDWDTALEGINQIIRGAMAIGRAIVTGAMALIKGILSAAWNLIVILAKAAWAKLTSAIQSGTARTISFVRDIPGKIKSALGRLGSLLIDAGRSLISGLMSGITGKLGELYSKVADIASEVKRRFKSMLQISSPSRVFEGYGLDIVEGLARGIQAGSRLPNVALAGVATSMASRPLSGAQMARGGTTASSVVEEHYHVHLPSGTALVGPAEDVASALAPRLSRRSRTAARQRSRRR